MKRELAEAIEPLVRIGYRVVSDSVDKRHFGDEVVVLEKQNVRLRVVRDRGEWFADVGFASDDDQYFDMSIVMRAVGGTSPLPEETRASLRALAEFIAKAARDWETLFDPQREVETRERLRSIEVASARERFGYVAE